MNCEDARKKIEALGIGYSEDNFFKYVQSGDREVVELFLDAGLPSDIRNAERIPAVLVANRSGQVDVARLLLARGAPPEPLLGRLPQGKDKWDKMSASSAILSFISGILIAAVGGYFTYSYNQRQIDLNRTQAQHDAATKDEANKVLELEAIQKLIPTLTAADEKGKAAALIAIQDLAHPELAAHLAVLFKGQGAVQYLQQAASSTNPNAKQLAVQALSTIAGNGKDADSQLAFRALAGVFDSTRTSVVKVVAGTEQETIVGSGVVVTTAGHILTSAHVVGHSAGGNVKVITWDGHNIQARVVSSDISLDLAILKVENRGLIPVRLAENPVAIGSDIIAIGYASGQGNEIAFVGSVAAVDDHYIYFNSFTASGVSGGPYWGIQDRLSGS
jgi:hypothetical protein